MQKIYKTAIVGGGAAGLLAAVELLSGSNCFKGEDVLILERNDRVGKKLIATGNGQGNLTNANVSENNYYGDKNFIARFIAQEKNLNLKEYFYRLGIPLGSGKDGKIYPLSKQASAVLDIFRNCISSKGCSEITSCYVEKITRKNDLFVINAGDKTFYAQNVIVAVGGKSAKQFGTDGSSYSLV